MKLRRSHIGAYRGLDAGPSVDIRQSVRRFQTRKTAREICGLVRQEISKTSQRLAQRP